MRLRSAGVNCLVVLTSLAVGLVLSELGARQFLNAADYLSVTTVTDEVLGIRVPPGTPGFDAWGFRNPRVPDTVDIVAIGDSHTYGNNAAMADSWPYVVARWTGRTVYNLSLGGYGPNQYYHLLTTRALPLRPRWVICGLYMGDDFENAFLMTYGTPYWSQLRQGKWAAADANIWQTPESNTWHRRVRVWLSRHSLIYRILVHGPVLGQLKGALQISQAAQGHDPAVTSLTVAAAGIKEAFRPIGLRDRLDQHSALVQEGMRLTFALLARMDRACRENNCQLVVVLIPTKETVFAEYLLSTPPLRLGEVIADLVTHERKARAQLVAFLDQARIPYVDALPALSAHTADHLYTPSDGDMHPNRNGYRVIGDAVTQFLRTAPAPNAQP